MQRARAVGPPAALPLAPATSHGCATLVVLSWGATLVLCCCTTLLDEEELETPLTGHAEELCVYSPPAPILAGGGAFSLQFPEGPYWIFGETILGDAGGNPTAFLGSTGALGSGCDLTPVLDASGSPALLVPLTADEQAHNDANPAGPRIALWPTTGFVADGVGIVYFRKVLVRGYFDLDLVGVGAARIGHGGVAERLTPGRFPEEPTLLWLAPQADWGSGAVVADGVAYVYGCIERSPFDRACRIARVSPERAGDAAAYEYFRAGAWSGSAGDAEVIVEGATALSVRFSEQLGAFVAVFTPPLDNEIRAALLPDPWGPFQGSQHLLDGVAPAQFWISAVEQHDTRGPELLLSYYTAPVAGAPGMRLVRYELP